MPAGHEHDLLQGFEVVPTTTVNGTTTWTYASDGSRTSEQSSRGLRLYGRQGYEKIGTSHVHELGPVVITRNGAADTLLHTPRTFAAWASTAEGKAWLKVNPGEKFPAASGTGKKTAGTSTGSATTASNKVTGKKAAPKKPASK